MTGRSPRGPGTGIASDGVIQPALPADAPAPHRSRSNTVTSAPRLVSASATHRPTAPPPTTITRTARLQSANPAGNGSVGSSRYWLIPVIQARPLTSGTTAGTEPRLVSSSRRPVNRLPMIDSLTNSWPSGELPPRVERGHPGRGPGAARGPIEPAGVDRGRVSRIGAVAAGRVEDDVLAAPDRRVDRMHRRRRLVDRLDDLEAAIDQLLRVGGHRLEPDRRRGDQRVEVARRRPCRS